MLRRNSARIRLKLGGTAVLFAGVAILLLPSVARAQQSATPKRILALYWYNKDYPANAEFDRSFQSVLKSAPAGSIEYYSEYLETNRFPGEDQAVALRDYLRRKYAHHAINVIVAPVDPPLNFFLKYRDDLFPHAPIIFGAARSPSAKELGAEPGMTGLINLQTYRENLDLALRLHPGTEHVFIVSGSIEHDKKYETPAREDLQGYESRVSITYLTDLSPNELSLRMKSLPERSIVLYIWQQAYDEKGRILETQEILRFITNSTTVPISLQADWQVGKGIVGGYVRSSESNAKWLAEIALRIANGERAQDIPVEKNPIVPMFDWRELKRWGISEDELPPGSIVRFKELSFWDLHKWEIIGVVSLCLVEALLILALLAQRARRRRVEEALRDNEERLKLALSAAHMGAWDWRLGADELNWSDEMRQIFGLTNGKSAVTTELFFDLIHPDDRRAVSQAIARTINEGAPYDVEFRTVHEDGGMRWVMGKGKALLNEAGQEARMLGVNMDITDRKRAEERLRSYFELPLIGMAITSPDRRFVEVNQKFCDILGYSMDQLTGMSWVDVTHPDDVAENIRLLDETLRGETEGYAMDKRFIHRDGRIVYASISARCARRADRMVDYLALVVQDITETKRAELNTQFINQLDFELSQIADADEIIRLATSRLGEYLGVSSCYVIEVNPAAGLAFVRESWDGWRNAGPSIVGEYRISDFVTPECLDEFEAGRATVVKDVMNDPRIRDFASKYKSLGIGAFISIPALNERQWEANLTVDHPQARDWRPDETQLMRDIAARLWPAFKRARAVEALRESEDRYRSVVESQTELICRFLPDTTLTFVNEPYCRYFNKTREEFIGVKFLELIPEPAREVTRKHIESLIENPRVEINEHEVLMPDGGIGWHQWVDHAILDASGKVVEFQAVGRDITERKQMEEERRENEERLRLALEAGRMGVWERDTRTNAVKWSKETFTIMGLSPFSLEPQYHTWADRVHPDDLPVAVEGMRKAIEEKTEYRYEYRIIWPDGSVRWVEDRAKPVYEEDGQCVKVSGLIVDITERKQAEDALRRSEARYRSVVESQTELICRYLPDTTLTFVNDAYCRYFGKPWEDLIGVKFLELIPESSRDYVSGMVESLTQRPRIEIYEHEVLLPDGGIGWQQWVDHAIRDAGGKIVEFQAVGRDITERKRAEQSLRVSEEALRESHTRIEDLAGRLIAAQEEERRHIARELHDDLNQQVAALAIGISRLRRQFPDAGAAAQEQFAKLREKTDWLSERIRQVSHELHSSILQHVGLPAALNSFCSEFSEREGIAVTLDIGDGVEAVSPDAALCLYRVAQESLRNVARHSGARSAIVALARVNGVIELRVSDQGVEFDPGQAREGSGLGLVSMKERVKLLHGNFVLTTRPGAGTELRAQIPSRREHEQNKGLAG